MAEISWLLISYLFLSWPCAYSLVEDDVSDIYRFSDQRMHDQSSEQGLAGVDSVADRINKFGFDLFNELHEGQEDIFISPLSIYVTLGLVYLGCGGISAKQLENTLHLGENHNEVIHEELNDLLTMLNQEQNDYSLFVANGAFLQQDYSFKDTYIEDAVNFYHAKVEKVDFAENSAAVTNLINEWVANKTRNKIPNFLQSPLSPDTIMALLNAVYFKGAWEKPFAEGDTRNSRFYKSNGEIKEIRFMFHIKQRFRYYEVVGGYQYLELPYVGDHIVMYIMLPPPDGNDGSERRLDGSDLEIFEKRLEERELVNVVIPKFKLKYRKNLVEPLEYLGLASLFTDIANLTGISSDESIRIDSIIHESVIEVNEQGTEAAAVSHVTVNRLGWPAFIANHPFFFHIIDKRNGLVIFSGKVNDP